MLKLHNPKRDSRAILLRTQEVRLMPVFYSKKLSSILGVVLSLCLSPSATEAIAGDLNGDGIVNYDDFFVLVSNFGKRGPIETPDTVRVTLVDTLLLTDTLVQTLHDTLVQVDTLLVTFHDTIQIAGEGPWDSLFDETGFMLHYDFDSESETTSEWSTGTYGDMSIQSGNMRLVGDESGYLVRSGPTHYMDGNVTISVTTNWVSGFDTWPYGLQFRDGDGGSYAFGITRAGQYVVWEWGSSGPPDRLADYTFSTHIDRSGPNTLRVHCTGSRLRFFINGHLVEDIDDASTSEGRVWVFVASALTVDFDDLVVRAELAELPARVVRDTMYLSSTVRDTVYLSSTIRDTVYLSSSSTPSISTYAIESEINGTFEGWTGSTLFELTNGQIWQQARYDYEYHYAYRPDVIIYRTYSGYYMMVSNLSSTWGPLKVSPVSATRTRPVEIEYESDGGARK
jgi:hypothetical protein